MIHHRVVALATAPLAWRSLAVLAAAIAAGMQLRTPTPLPVADPVTVAPRSELLRIEPAPRISAVYPAIAAHPLFSPTRRPYVPPPAPAPAMVAASSPLRDYQLLGTVVDGGAGVALLKPPGSRDTIRVIPGQVVAGWRLREITPDALEFTNGAARFTVHFPRPRWPHP